MLGFVTVLTLYEVKWIILMLYC